MLIVEAMNDDAIQMFAMVIVKSFDLWSSWCGALHLFCSVAEARMTSLGVAHFITLHKQCYTLF